MAELFAGVWLLFRMVDGVRITRRFICVPGREMDPGQWSFSLEDDLHFLTDPRISRVSSLLELQKCQFVFTSRAPVIQILDELIELCTFGAFHVWV